MHHQLSLQLETLVRRALKTGWGGFGHVAHADYIDMPGGAFVAIIAALAPYYKESDGETRSKIDSFIDKWRILEQEKVKNKAEEVKNLIVELNQLLSELEK